MTISARTNPERISLFTRSETPCETRAPRRTRRFASGLAGAALVLLAVPAGAGGIGGNFSFSRSEGKVEDTDDFFADLNTSADHYELGVAVDTNLAADRLFNYRISANAQFVDQKINQTTAKKTIQGSGFALNQIFGLGLVRTPRVRLFVGPTIHLGIAGFDDHDDDRIGGSNDDFEETLITAGLGPAIGLNYNVGRHLTISLVGHYWYGLQVQGYDDPYDTNNSDGIFTGYEHRVGFTTSIFYRFSRDQYAPGTNRPK